MTELFAQIGIPFPLFEAPVDEAVDYLGLGTCSLCGGEGKHCFLLEVGCGLILRCPECGAENGLDCCTRENGACRLCGQGIPFPLVGASDIRTCYDCLRAGKAAITKGTELGMISWEQAFEGVTHGLPRLDRRDFEMVPRSGGWIGARLPRETMMELLRTPTYETIQGDLWQFCCRQPMIYIGEWSREEFTRRSPDGNGQRYFEEIVQDSVPGLWEDQLHDTTGVYVFRCSLCSRLTAHWDVA